MNEKQIIAEGRYIRLLVQDNWEYVERLDISGIVAIVAVTNKAELIFVEQYRPPVKGRVIEMPAGLAGDLPESRGESLEKAATRELLEETGYAVEKLERLFDGPPSPGLASEVVTWFMGREARKVGPGGGDETEDIDVFAIPIAEAFSWLEAKQAEGKMIDPKVFVGLYYAQCQTD